MTARISLLAILLLVGAMVVPALVRADFATPEATLFSGAVFDFTRFPATPGAATINWGDGQSNQGTIQPDGSGGYFVSGSHYYPEEGDVQGSVQLCGSGPGYPVCESGPFTATVFDRTLSASGTDVSGMPGQSLSATVATFADPNSTAPTNDFTAVINWGDGQTTSGTITPASQGSWTVSGDHTYAAAGTYTIQTSITDRGGSVVGAQSYATVSTPQSQCGSGSNPAGPCGPPPNTPPPPPSQPRFTISSDLGYGTSPDDCGYIFILHRGSTKVEPSQNRATLVVHRFGGSTGPISFGVNPAGFSGDLITKFDPQPTFGGDGSTVTLTVFARRRAPLGRGFVFAVRPRADSASDGRGPRKVWFCVRVVRLTTSAPHK